MQCEKDQAYLVDLASYKEGHGDALLGKLIGGEFAIVGLLGVGGFGSVYRGIQNPIGRTVAVKILHGHAYRREEVRRRFIREAKALAQLSDPCIVQFIRFGEQRNDGPLAGQNFFFIAQEYIDGALLRRIIREASPLPWSRVRFLARSILKALAAAHKKGITHRDLKPSNIMICEDAFQGDLVKVLDFGIAKFRSGQEDEDEQTVTGTLLGTPNYMSPEQIRNENVGPASDLYSVGILIYEMLTGQRPFERDTKIDTLRAHLNGDKPDLSTLPRVARDVVERAISRLPADRYPNARAMAEALDIQDSLGSFTSDAEFLELETLQEEETSIDAPEERTAVDMPPRVSSESSSMLPTPVNSSGSTSETVRTSVGRTPFLSWVSMVLFGTALGAFGWWALGSSSSKDGSSLRSDEAQAPAPAKAVQQTPSTAPVEASKSATKDEGASSTVEVSEPLKKLTSPSAAKVGKSTAPKAVQPRRAQQRAKKSRQSRKLRSKTDTTNRRAPRLKAVTKPDERKSDEQTSPKPKSKPKLKPNTTPRQKPNRARLRKTKKKKLVIEEL